MRILLLLASLLVPAGILSAQPKNLDMYWIDVEGGAATLMVSPSGESLLFDAGWEVGDRDAKRIFAAAQQAGLTKIDYFVLSHFHADHAGGSQRWRSSYRSADVSIGGTLSSRRTRGGATRT